MSFREALLHDGAELEGHVHCDVFLRCFVRVLGIAKKYCISLTVSRLGRISSIFMVIESRKDRAVFLAGCIAFKFIIDNTEGNVLGRL